MPSRSWDILDSASFSRTAARVESNRSVTCPSGVAKANDINWSRNVIEKTSYFINILGNKIISVGKRLKENKDERILAICHNCNLGFQ